MANTVIGVFSENFEADAAISDLKQLGYDPQDISVIVKNNSEANLGKGGSASSGIFSGIAAGGLLGGLAGLLVGLGALTIPTLGLFLIGGPIAGALGLTGAIATAVSGATTGILAGGLVGALVSLGIPENVAKIYEERVHAGGVLLAVPVRNDTDRENVMQIFNEYNADQVRTMGELKTR